MGLQDTFYFDEGKYQAKLRFLDIDELLNGRLTCGFRVRRTLVGRS